MQPSFRRILVSIAIAAVIVVSVLWSVFAQTPAQQAEQLSVLAYGTQSYLPIIQLDHNFGPTSTPSPRPPTVTPYGAALFLPPALRAEQPFQVASAAGRLFAAIAGGTLLLFGVLVARKRFPHPQ